MRIYGAHHKTMKSTDSKNDNNGNKKGGHKAYKYNRFSHDSTSVRIKAPTDKIDGWSKVYGLERFMAL